MATTTAPPAPPVVRTRCATVSLPAEMCVVGAVRHFVSDLLNQWGVAHDDQDTAALIVDELAANSAQHGRATMAVNLSLDDDSLLIEVADSGEPARSSPLPAIADDEHGRGLGIVDVLTEWSETHQGQSGWQTRTCLHLAPLLPDNGGAETDSGQPWGGSSTSSEASVCT
ncbi:ATP-binding protein [Streptomyces sp. TRM72054]|uniref:ATP-binding protein n=1 Tax=Streptomyces sp. TRM72054 TaxID=2870562 RepID=UPI001C8C58B2|nr:ATP-binding protein [Streptomyces sp. TRM72054]MBX9399545.1 ATP-binding protein [Streptomyces sp. TRM72054]